MKDSLGHGSDKQGIAQAPAHQNKVVRLSPHQSTKIIPSSIPGLQYVKDQITANKYFSLQHAASGKTVGEWRAAPVKETDKNFVAHIDSVMKQHNVDWTRDEAGLGKIVTPEIGTKIRNSLSSAMNRDAMHGSDYKIRRV